MRKDKCLSSITLRTAAVLILLVAVTTSVVVERFASYKTADSDSGAARVAKFQITEAGTLTKDLTVDIAPGEQIEKTVVVTNGSEVTVDYTVDAQTLYGNLPLTITVLDGETESTQARLDAGQSKTLTVRITWPSDQNDDAYAGQVDMVRVILTASQVD